MAVDRLSVTVPSELGAALRALAAARGSTVSTIVSDAIGHAVRLAALELALREADRAFGAVDETTLANVEAVIVRGPTPRKRPRRRT